MLFCSDSRNLIKINTVINNLHNEKYVKNVADSFVEFYNNYLSNKNYIFNQEWQINTAWNILCQLQFQSYILYVNSEKSLK